MSMIGSFHIITENKLQKLYLHVQSLFKGALKMRVFQLILLCFTCAIKNYGQTVANSYGKIDVEITKQKRPKNIFAKVEITSVFRGGDSSWTKSLETSLNQSLSFRNGAKKGKYTVSVVFMISKDGSISEVRCIADPGFGMCEEVLRVVAKSRRWVPAEQHGRQVREYRKG